MAEGAKEHFYKKHPAQMHKYVEGALVHLVIGSRVGIQTQGPLTANKHEQTTRMHVF